MKRKSGFYWIRVSYCKEFTIARYSEHTKLWLINGIRVKEKDITDIDENQIIR